MTGAVRSSRAICCHDAAPPRRRRRRRKYSLRGAVTCRSRLSAGAADVELLSPRPDQVPLAQTTRSLEQHALVGV